MPKPVRVLIVEDSPVSLQLLVSVLSSVPGITVAGTARNGREAVEAVDRLHPDVVTMDVVMPVMNGLEATRQLMKTRPVPIIIVSGTVNRNETATTFEALRAGAVAAIPRLAGPGHPEHEQTVRELVRTVRLMAEVRVVRRWESPEQDLVAAPQRIGTYGHREMVIGIGGSTGGTEALHKVLALLPERFPFPILVVQHMSPGFIESFAEWLDGAVPLRVRLAQEGEAARGGNVYVAPDHCHLGLDRERRLRLSRSEPEKGLRPAVSFLFRSLLLSCGSKSAAVLLSGMGTDGAAELKALREAGALTIAQDRGTSVIFGMPGEAVRLEAATYCLPPERIAAVLTAKATG